MSQTLTAKDILEEIEFELMQGAITSDELGKGIQDVRKHHAQLRSSLFDSGRNDVDSTELIRRQFQINDMLLTILNEVALKLRASQLDLYRMGRWQMKNGGQPQATTADQEASADSNESMAGDDGELVERPAYLSDPSLNPVAATANATEIESAMEKDTLGVGMMVRNTPIPVVGWFLQRVRGALHSLTVFYVNQLAQQQTEVNQTYGDSLIDLMQSNHRMEEEIRHLRTEIQRLQSSNR